MPKGWAVRGLLDSDAETPRNRFRCLRDWASNAVEAPGIHLRLRCQHGAAGFFLQTGSVHDGDCECGVIPGGGEQRGRSGWSASAVNGRAVRGWLEELVGYRSEEHTSELQSPC